MILAVGALVVSISLPAWAGVLPPAPHDLPGIGSRGGNGSPESSSKICGSKLHVFNRIETELKFIYAWDSDQRVVQAIKGQEVTTIAPVYCPSSLIVLTGNEQEGRRSEKVVDPERSYEVLWSQEDKKYIVRPVNGDR